jgi:hypothetical protein
VFLLEKVWRGGGGVFVGVFEFLVCFWMVIYGQFVVVRVVNVVLW